MPGEAIPRTFVVFRAVRQNRRRRAVPNTPGYWRERRLSERLWRGCGVSAIERLLFLAARVDWRMSWAPMLLLIRGGPHMECGPVWPNSC